MVRNGWCGAVVLTVTSLLAASAATGQQLQTDAAAPVNGFPTWEERVLHEWINRARVAPAADLSGCGTNCSVAEMQPNCYAPVPPLMWRYELNVAARFHSDSMMRQNFFAHSTPCALRADLATLYPGSCDGSAACACSGSGSTSPSARAALFGASWSGEIIAAGYSDPDSAFYGWLWEPVQSSAPCAYSNYGSNNTNGHRWLILTSLGSMGPGYSGGGQWGTYYTTDFGGGGTTSAVPSGAHFPGQAATVDFWANWYSDRAPAAARVVIDTTSAPLVLNRGTSTNGAWKATVAGFGSGCHRYYFEFTDASGQPVRHPASGTFGLGPAGTCADWQETQVTGPPPVLTATTASTTSVQLSWTASTGATQYEVQRAVGDLAFTALTTVGTTAYNDNIAPAGQACLYRVRAVGTTTWSNVDYASTLSFTDETLVTGVTTVKALHVTQLRSAANAIRVAVGLTAKSWTNASPTVIRAVDFEEIRAAINDARLQIGAAQLSFTDSTLGTSVPVRAVHVNELRNAMR